MERHNHEWKEEANFLVCSICQAKRLKLQQIEEGLLQGRKQNGEKYSVRKHRKSWILPDTWNKAVENMRSERAKRTANILIQTGARINEARHIEKRDFDWDRNTLRLRVVKTKARKAGEERGSPRTIPISIEFMKEMNKFFRNKPDNESINILTTPGFNKVLKRALKKAGVKDYYMYSAHSVRKTHGNWLKILSNARLINCDAIEICSRLGHNYETFLLSYPQENLMNPSDLILARNILGGLY